MFHVYFIWFDTRQNSIRFANLHREFKQNPLAYHLYLPYILEAIIQMNYDEKPAKIMDLFNELLDFYLILQ